MKIIESVNFIYEKEDFLKKQFGIQKKDALSALDGFHTSIHWLRTSIFRNIVKDLTIYISDDPINFPGELAIDEGDDFEPVIYVNAMSIAEDYKNKEYLLDMKRDDVGCFEYAAFILMHELGHYVHSMWAGQGKEKRDRLFDYFGKGESHYIRYEEEMVDGSSYKEKKRYRNIPHEKAADNFAKQYVDMIMKG